MVPYHHSDTMVIFFCNQIIFFSSNFFYPKKTRNYEEQISILCGCLQEKYRMDFQYLDRVLVTGQSVCEKKILKHMRPKTFPWY